MIMECGSGAAALEFERTAVADATALQGALSPTTFKSETLALRQNRLVCPGVNSHLLRLSAAWSDEVAVPSNGVCQFGAHSPSTARRFGQFDPIHIFHLTSRGACDSL